MNVAHGFLTALTIVLGVAAVTTVVFQRLRQPVVLGYVLAGLLVGPHVPSPLVADHAVVETLSELGVILLMFSLGLEFSLRRLVRVGAAAALTAVIETSLMMWLGFVVGRALGWTTRESVFAGAMVAISSTTIIAKAFDERGVKGRLRELVVGVLIVEDLIAILILATLTAISTGARPSAQELAGTTGRLAAFLVVLVVVGMLLVPRAMRAIARLKRPETTLVATIGLCFGIALLAREVGYSVALGAFIAGSLVAESGEEHEVAALVRPVRDMFVAVFFVSIGMLIDPALVAENWRAVAALFALVVAGKVCGVSLGAFLTGNGVRTAVQAGMSLAQIGEFSFIIASLGLSLGVTRGFLFPVAVAVSALTMLTTPWLIQASGAAANLVDRRLPRALQTFAALYGSWFEHLRARRHGDGEAGRIRRLVRLLLLDAALLASLLIATPTALRTASSYLQHAVGLTPAVGRALVGAAAAVLAVPFLVGIVRLAGRLGLVLASRALPESVAGKTDLAAAPRRALVLTLQLGIVLLVAIPLAALTAPFLPRGSTMLAVTVLVVLLGTALWRSATNLQGHVQAGAQMIAHVLATQSRHQGSLEHSLAQVKQLLPGIGEPVPVLLDKRSPGAGKSLAELNLRGLTGATVLAIVRAEQGALIPTAAERLRAGDVLAIAGTNEAIAAAKGLLLGTPTKAGDHDERHPPAVAG